MDTPEIFDRTARRLRRDRISAGFAAHDFLRATMVESIAERLASVTRAFHDVLEIGSFDGDFSTQLDARVARCDAGFRFALASRGVQADEDRLPFADQSFDLVVSAGVLDTVNDLPGALSLIRRVLRPDGLFLGAFLGAGSLPTLRAILRTAEGERPAARIHPPIDVRAGGDLLMRAGFALPVADIEMLDVRYATLRRLLDDLRGAGASNLLVDRSALSRATLGRMVEAFEARREADGRVTERFAMVIMTGWAPGPDQPQPARRGSATASLRDALRPN